MKNSLIIKNLKVSTTEGKEILKGISLKVKKGEIHAIMGPNGSGKSTFAQSLMGHPGFVITSGTINLNGVDITKLTPDKKAKMGLFLGFQYPVEVAGVNFANFLRLSINTNLKNGEKKVSPLGFRSQLLEKSKLLAFSEDISQRSLNEGFSGGEKKKAEVLQLSLLKPEFAILDEPDSGLDIDALRYISRVINNLNFPLGLIIITHYQRILHYIKPDFVHILVNGKIIKSSEATLAKEIEEKGYENYLN